jgi:hypothetical protein
LALILAKRIFVARSVKVDDIVIAWICENRMISRQGVLTYRRKPQVTVTAWSIRLLVDNPAAAIAVPLAPSVPIKSRPAKNDVAIFMMVTSFLFVSSTKAQGKLCARAWCNQK